MSDRRSERVWLPVAEVAAKIGATPGQLRQALKVGTLRGRKVGTGRRGVWLIRVEDARHYFETQPPQGPRRQLRGRQQQQTEGGS